MNALTHTIAARAYRLASRPPLPEQPVELAPGVVVPSYVARSAESVAHEARRFFDRLPPWFDVAGRSVLDVGAGGGALCVEAARRGAARVLGLEISEEYVRVGRLALGREAADVAGRIEIELYSGDLRELGDRRFEVVLSKDCFEHYGAAPGSPSAGEMVAAMHDLLVPGGLLAIGFGPLWKAPWGGHIDARLPWAHLLFPETVIFDEFRRVRPPGKTARTFEEGTGVNRMTFARFRRIMDASGLEELAFTPNAGDGRAMRAMRALRRVPALRELMTQNVYGVWRRPGVAAERLRRVSRGPAGVAAE